MAGNAIKMKDNTWGGDKRRLGLGTTHLVPDEVSAEDAKTLVAAGKAEWIEAGGAPEATREEVAAAIKKLDKANKSLFTADGKPQVKALEDLIGKTVTAAVRDAAWVEAAG